MQLFYYGHSCLSLSKTEKDKKTTILFDPFIDNNPVAPCKATDVEADYILVSHDHGDHSSDTVPIAKKNDAMVISTFDFCGSLAEQNIQCHGMNIGGPFQFPFGKVRLTQAIHSFGSGSGGASTGFIVDFFGTVIYFAGDTALFSDMALYKRHNIDYAFLPIGSNFTMDIEDAVEAAKLLQAKTVIPIHYNTWPLIEADPEEFKALVEKNTSSKCLIAPIGKNINLL